MSYKHVFLLHIYKLLKQNLFKMMRMEGFWLYGMILTILLSFCKIFQSI